ncbi:TolC family protein [Pleomorphovibrio marinus]|uniref:TolC family protein n=1 Tax=Pleomorphovibrio marinus TaxID=2164132 RepID=UPI000E0A7E8E|nr:TolC family protein [Pleomorphovibrio marinus]
MNNKNLTFQFKLLVFLLIFWGSIPLAQGQRFSLAACVEYARENNQSLLLKHLEEELSHLGERESKAFMVPELYASGNMEHYWRIPVLAVPGEIVGQPGEVLPVRFGTPWMGEAGFQASWNILDPGAMNRVKLAKLTSSAKAHEREVVESSLVKHVHIAYRALILQEESLENLANAEAYYSEIHRSLGQLLEKGRIDQITLNQSEVILGKYREKLANRKWDKEMAENDLKFWMGFPLDQPLYIESSEIETLPEMAAEGDFPGFAHQQAMTLLRKEEYQGTRNSWLPVLRLRAAYNQMYFGESLRIGAGENWLPVGFMGLQVQFPLFSMGKHFHEPTRKKMEWKRQELAKEEFLAKENHGLQEVKARVEQARTSLATAERELALAEENVRLSRLQLEKERLDVASFRQVQIDMMEALEHYLQRKLDYHIQTVEMAYLSGQF